jgi:hypothetical protein
MGKGKPLSTEEKIEICQLKIQGFSNRHIYTKLKRSCNVVQKYLKDPENYGKRVLGRPRKKNVSVSNSPVMTNTYTSCVDVENPSPTEFIPFIENSSYWTPPVPEMQFTPMPEDWSYQPHQQLPNCCSEVPIDWNYSPVCQQEAVCNPEVHINLSYPAMYQQQPPIYNSNMNMLFEQFMYFNTMAAWQQNNMQQEQASWNANSDTYLTKY